MTVAPWPHTGAILTGGASRRMGTPKHALALPDGRLMIEHVAGAMAGVCRRLVLVGDVRDVLAELPRIEDLRPEQGPLGGIEALLASGVDREFLVCPCDVPLVPVDLLVALTAPTARGVTALKIRGETSVRPLPARFSVSVLPDVQRLLDAGRRAVHELLRSVEVEVVEVPAGQADALRDIDTPEEYESLYGRD